MIGKRILVVESDTDVAEMLRVYLVAMGYQVVVVTQTQEALEVCHRDVPSAAIVDSQHSDALIRDNRGLFVSCYLPIIVLSKDRDDKWQALAQGADDFLVKPFELKELYLRLSNLLFRADLHDVEHRLTGLPTARLAERQLEEILAHPEERWALMQVTLDHFAAFTGIYGYIVGDNVLLFVASALQRAVRESGRPQDRVYHVATDSFAVITTPERVDAIADHVFREVAQAITDFYSPADRDAGHITLQDRRGQLHKVPLMSVSVGVVTNLHRSFNDIRDVSRVAEQVTNRARQMPGNSLYVDQRRI